MVSRHTTFRGLPLAMMERSLEDLGGRREGQGWVGEGWRASLAHRKVLAFVYMLDEIDFTIEGDQEAVDRVLKGLRVAAWGSGRPKG